MVVTVHAALVLPVVLGGTASATAARELHPTGTAADGGAAVPPGGLPVELFAPSECPSEETFEELVRANVPPRASERRRIGAFVVPERGGEPPRYRGVFLIEDPDGPAAVRTIAGERSCETLVQAMALSCAIALDGAPAPPAPVAAPPPPPPATCALPAPQPPATTPFAMFAGAMFAPGMLPRAAPTLVTSVRWAGAERRQRLLVEGTGQWTPSTWSGTHRVALGVAVCGAATAGAARGAFCAGGEIADDRLRGLHSAVALGGRLSLEGQGPILFELRPELALFPAGGGILPRAGGEGPFAASPFVFRVAAVGGVRF